MKIKVLLLLLLSAASCLYSINIEAKIQGENPDEIDWDIKKERRSLFPIGSHIKDGVVTIYFYGQPEAAAITIEDSSGGIVYQDMVIDASVVNINLKEYTGSFTIMIEYDSELYYGKFELY